MKHSRISGALVIAAFVAAITGCSRIPTAPAANTANLARTGVGAANTMGRIDDVPPPIVGEGHLVHSITLDGNSEGTLTTGRFTLVIHKNSLKMPATIAMIVPNEDAMEVEFEVTPPEANGFAVPVQLVADCSNEELEHVMDETMFWFDEQWNEAPASSVYHIDRTITAHAHELRSGMIDLRSQGKATKLQDPIDPSAP